MLKEFKLTKIDQIQPLKGMMIVKFIAEKDEFVSESGLIITTKTLSDTPDQDARMKPREHAPGMGLYQIVKMGEKDAKTLEEKVQLNDGDYMLTFDLDSQQTINKLPIADGEKYFLVNQFLGCSRVDITEEDFEAQSKEIPKVQPRKKSDIKVVGANTKLHIPN